MSKQSAGLLLYRVRNGSLEVFLAHPGGTFYVRRDLGVWSIPKGEFEDDESAFNAAQREFAEETGFEVSGEFIELTPIKQKSGKKVFAWAVEADIDASRVSSNTFSLEFPRGSGRMQEYPEIDRADWFGIAMATQKIIVYQVDLIHELSAKLGFVDSTEVAQTQPSNAAASVSQPSLFS